MLGAMLGAANGQYSIGVGSAGAGSAGVLRIAMGGAGVRWSLRQQGVGAQMLKVLGILRLHLP